MKDFYRTDEQVDFDNLPDYWARVERTHSQLTALPASHLMTNALTQRRMDEAQVAGIRTYIEADRMISVAMDNHLALRALLERWGASLWAPWSLLRPQFECAALACWVLDPTEGLERRRRGLRCEVRDYREQDRHLQTFEGVPELRRRVIKQRAARKAGSEQVYRDEAARLGLVWDSVHQSRSLSIVDLLPKLNVVAEVADPSLAAYYVATWRLLSGFEHGLSWAGLHGNKQTERQQIPGGMELSTVIDDEAFVLASKLTMRLLMAALDRFIYLHTKPPAAQGL